MLTAAKPESDPAQDGHRQAARPLLLIVDDHADTREMLRYTLELHGYVVVEAADGEAAVQMTGKMLPDLILMDTRLPGVDGLTATRRIRQLESAKKISIIFLSGHAEAQQRESALAAGANDYFVKPVNLAELERAIEKQLARANYANP
jgi:CheY-like chemotaxis protein